MPITPPTKAAATRRRLPALRAGLSPRRRWRAGVLTGLVVLPLLTVILVRLRGVLSLPSQMLLFLLAVVVVALVGGRIPALAATAAAGALLTYYFIPPLNDFPIADSDDVVALAGFLVVAVAICLVVGLAASRAREAETLAAVNAESREELRVLADEQSALRRVATLVARGLPPGQVFAAVAQEVGRVLGADATGLFRLDPDGEATVVARIGDSAEMPVGSRWTPEPSLALAAVLRTGRPARSDDYDQARRAAGPTAYGGALGRLSLRSWVAAPIVVEGRRWGAIMVGTRREHLPADAEQRMAGFTELVGTAIANAEGRAQLEENRDELRRLAQEQAALRRIATLVARGVPPAEVLTAVAQEVGDVLGADGANILRLDPDGVATVMARVGAYPAEFTIGSRWKPEPPLPMAVVLRTGRPARADDFSLGVGAYADAIRRLGFRSGVALPISVEGRLWGAIGVATQHERFPADTEQRVADFTELVGTAIANAQARMELLGFADEQAALRRLATQVAQGAAPEEVFAAVAAEAGQLLSADLTTMGRYEPDGTVNVVGQRSGTGDDRGLGAHGSLGGRNLGTLVFETGRSARIDDFSDASGPLGEVGRGWGVLSGVGMPIMVEGGLWGFLSVASVGEEPMPADTEARLAGFTELVATAIANAQARLDLRGHAEEQAALRRVATLVARAASPDEVFAAVTEEIGQVLDADQASMSRYNTDGTVTLVARWHNATVPVGTQWSVGGHNVHTQVFQTGQPARIDRYADASGPSADVGRRLGARSAVGAPINVEGRLWGVVLVTSTRPERLSGQIEARLVGFTELVGTAIANADSRAQLTASRARIVAAADDARRRIERDLHDGTQQRLIAVSLAVRLAQTGVPAELPQLQTQLGRVADELNEAIDELRELARGIHPAILSRGGLGAALRSLARRAALPVRLDIPTTTRVADPIAVAAYYVVSEALTNTTKHARASQVHVTVEQRDAILHLSIRDNGIGGADPAGGSGLIGLRDRVQALGGMIEVTSRPREGTTIVVELPVQPD